MSAHPGASTNQMFVISLVFATLIAIACLVLFARHGIYRLSRSDEWVAWIAVLFTSALYGFIVQKAHAFLFEHMKPVLATMGTILIAIALAYASQAALELVGFGLNSSIMSSDRARGAVIALGTFAPIALLVGGFFLLATVTVRRQRSLSFSSIVFLLAGIIAVTLLQPRVL